MSDAAAASVRDLIASLAGAADANAFRIAGKAVLAASDRELETGFDAEQDIDQLLAARAAAVDAVVVEAWRRALGDDESGAALVATGGYGRGELFPHSDIDLLVLADEAAQQRLRPRIEAFTTALWDLGLAPGQAVRSLAQCGEQAAEDVTVATALLEARLLAGDPQAMAALQQALSAPGLWPPADYFRAKRDEQEQRHARYHDTAYNLEPNLKDGPGGLRDVQTLAWMAQRIHGVARLSELAANGAIGEDEFATLERARRKLARLRCGLHLVAGRREERLLFDYQTALAGRLGFTDGHRENLAVEQLMQGFFRSAAMVLRLNARLLQRFEEQLEGAAAERDLGGGFLQRGKYLALEPADRLQREPELILALFRTWQEHPELRGLHSETARALGEALDGVDALRQDPAMRAQFLAILRGERAVPTLARMAELGVLGRYLPPFGRVAGRMQYDLFHVYTVDQHTLTVLRNIASFPDESSTERFALAHQVWPRLRKPELLLLAGLFHDIAKGRGGDHSELGAEEARTFCRDHGLGEADTELVVWLVLHHLAMSITAQRQDISDPEVVQRFARLVGERERLDYLYLLTVADIAGTSPKLWNAWKDRLMADLYGATRFALRQGLEHRAYAAERIAETREAARKLLLDGGLDPAELASVWEEFPDESFLRYRPEQLAWQTRGIAAVDDRDAPLVMSRPHARPGALEVFVYSPDRDGLFATVAAALDRLGLSVVEARVVSSRRGMSLDTFQVLDAGTEYVGAERRAATVVEVLDRALAQTPYRVTPVRRAVPRQLRHFRRPARIDFTPDPVAGRTQMALVCSDRPGLLAQVAATLREHGVRIHDARIATFGERVEDFFQLTDENDQPLSDPAQREVLREALVACVDEAYGDAASPAAAS